MIPNWSDKHPNKRAKKIYNEAFVRVLVIGSLVLIFLPVLISSLARQLGWPDWMENAGGGVGVGVVVVMALAHARGVRALKRAGLVREQCEIIARTATTFEGETLEVRESSVGARLSFVLFFLLLVAGCYWLWQSQPFNPLFYWCGIVSAILFSVFALQTLFHAWNPELRLDERGITSCQGWMASRLVRWEISLV